MKESGILYNLVSFKDEFIANQKNKDRKNEQNSHLQNDYNIYNSFNNNKYSISNQDENIELQEESP